MPAEKTLLVDIGEFQSPGKFYKTNIIVNYTKLDDA